MPTREELDQRIDRTLTLAGMNAWSPQAQIVRGVLEGLNTPPPKRLDDELAMLLRKIASEATDCSRD